MHAPADRPREREERVLRHVERGIGEPKGGGGDSDRRGLDRATRESAEAEGAKGDGRQRRAGLLESNRLANAERPTRHPCAGEQVGGGVEQQAGRQDEGCDHGRQAEDLGQHVDEQQFACVPEQALGEVGRGVSPNEISRTCQGAFPAPGFKGASENLAALDYGLASASVNPSA